MLSDEELGGVDSSEETAMIWSWGFFATVVRSASASREGMRVDGTRSPRETVRMVEVGFSRICGSS